LVPGRLVGGMVAPWYSAAADEFSYAAGVSTTTGRRRSVLFWNLS